MFSQPFIFHFLPILLPYLNFDLELIPGIGVISGSENYSMPTKSPLSLLVICQHADHCPLCEHDCISNAQQVIIAMQIQRCWTQGLADLCRVAWIEGGNGDCHPVFCALLPSSLGLDKAVEVPGVSAGDGLQVESLLSVQETKRLKGPQAKGSSLAR